MPMKKCIVKCDTPSEILFTIPTKDDVFNLWKITCGERVKLTKGMYIYICANHFTTNNIIRKRLLTSGEAVVGVVSISYLVNINLVSKESNKLDRGVLKVCNEPV